MTQCRTGSSQRRRQILDVAAAGIWLIFLAFPAFAMMRRQPTAEIVALWVVGLAVFVGGYLGAFYLFSILRPRGSSAAPMRLAAGSTALMLLGSLAMWPGSGTAVVYTAPYFIALWAFTQRLRVGFVAAALILAAALAIAWRSDVSPEELIWIAIPLLMSATPILLGRVASEHEDRTHLLNTQYEASQQREAIARDVHDILGHSLTVVAVKAELARRLVTTDPLRAQAELDDVLRLTRESLGQVRDTVAALRSPDLTDQIAATRTALDAAHVEAVLPTPDEIRAVPEPQATVFASCLREAVTNVVRHAQATRCTVTVTPRLLTVEDDGVGLGHEDGATLGGAGAANPASDADSLPSHGTGLRGIRSRASEIGARMSLSAGAGGRGTRVEVRV